MNRARRLARGFAPPLFWSPTPTPEPEPVVEEPGPVYRIVETLDQVEAELLAAEALAQTSEDDFRASLLGFRFEPPGLADGDPDTPAYREAQFALYREITGTDTYDPRVAEHTSFDLEVMLDRPFPYTATSTILGEQLMAIGYLIRAGGFTAGMSVLEFGPGWGKTTIELAELGTDVTAVDVNPRFLTLVAERARRRGRAVHTVEADMLSYEPDRRFDRVLFFESFHHCSDPHALVARLGGMLNPGGAVIFAGEPIVEDFHAPWGLRLDGLSVWSMRRFGWLELGFSVDYFRDLLERNGFVVEYLNSVDVAWNRVFVATGP